MRNVWNVYVGSTWGGWSYGRMRIQRWYDATAASMSEKKLANSKVKFQTVDGNQFTGHTRGRSCGVQSSVPA